jgi:hypothetical protein
METKWSSETSVKLQRAATSLHPIRQKFPFITTAVLDSYFTCPDIRAKGLSKTVKTLGRDSRRSH